MKKYLLIILVFFISNNKTSFGQIDNYETYVEYSLEISDHKLKGSSLQLAGYDVSMNLPTDFLKDSLRLDSLISLIRNQDINGEFIFPNGKTTEIKYSIIPFHDSVTIFMKTSNGWFPWEKMRIENNILIFSYDYWYCPPASKTDLEILDLCFDYLKDSTYWNQNDVRECDDAKENRLWSLFCAIKIASIEKMGEYNHRNTVIQTARFVIDELYPKHGYTHTLMDFNNNSSTRYNDVINVLNIVKDRIEMEIKNNEE